MKMNRIGVVIILVVAGIVLLIASNRKRVVTSSAKMADAQSTNSWSDWLKPDLKSKMDALSPLIEDTLLRFKIAFQNIDQRQLEYLHEKTHIGISAIDKKIESYTDAERFFVYDVIAKCQIVDVIHEPSYIKNFHTKFRVQLIDVMKSPSTIRQNDTITILQRSGRLSDGRFLDADDKICGKDSSVFVFFLSNSHLLYYLSSVGGNLEEYSEKSFLSSDIYYHVSSLDSVDYRCPGDIPLPKPMAYKDFRAQFSSEILAFASLNQ
jgi:hypothetical protein